MDINHKENDFLYAFHIFAGGGGKTNISTELFLLCLAFDLQKFFSKLQRGKRKSHLFSLKKELNFSELKM